MRKVAFAFILFFCFSSKAQVKVSFATDVSALRNFSPNQQFWALGQTVQANFHFNQKETFYTWFIYHTPGRFQNNFSAVAKSSSNSPAVLNFRAKGKWNMREFSMGWKHYFKGAYNSETHWSLYGIAGLGLMFSKVENTFEPLPDTAVYALPPRPLQGLSEFRRLTVDLGLGGEIPLGGNFFIYGDVRTYLPSSSFPSPYLHSTSNVPLPLMANFGVRILFDFSY